MEQQRKIGILGTGIVSKTLAGGFVKYGYDVMAGSRSGIKKLDGFDTNVKSGDFTQTAAFGDVIVLAVKGTAAQNVLAAAGIKNLEGKIIIDATNPIADAPPQKGVLQFTTTLDFSLM
ncbi:MAG TPA: NAD(P)-binding domain-containing protein, partial [Flavobacterium sp.]|nr:NAD(P)-binding domain-containing protein [Flavobacterium sp.]